MLSQIFLHRLQYLSRPIEPLNEVQMMALSHFKEKWNAGVYQWEDVPCLCQQRNSVFIARTDRYALPVQTHLCKSCGMMWTSPRMTPETLAKFYEEDYRPLYVGNVQVPEDFFEEQIQHGKFIYQFVETAMRRTQMGTVFDVGCGAGGVLIPFKKAGWSTFGCDMGSEYLRYGRSIGIVLEHGEAITLKKYGQADLVILSHVLEHFSHPLYNVTSIAQLVKEGGYVYVEVPGIFKIHSTYGDTLRFLQNAHLYHFTLMTLTSLMAKAGFRCLKGDGYVHALFQKDQNNSQIVTTTDQFRKILIYLYCMEIEHLFHPLALMSAIRRVTGQLIKIIMGETFLKHLKQKLGLIGKIE